MMDHEHPGYEPAAQRTASSGSRPRSLLGGLGVILAVVAFCVSAYLWYALTRSNRILGSHLVTRVARTESRIAALDAQTAMQEKQIRTLLRHQTALEGTVLRLSGNVRQKQRHWAVAEAVHLLVIANHRLQLDHEIGLSLAALKAADRQLHRANDPRLLPVRRLIAGEIVALQGLRTMDVSGLALRLQSMAAAIHDLPLGPDMVYRPAATAVARKAAPYHGWRRFLVELRTDFSHLIRIQHSGRTAPPLLAPKRAYFLRQNLELMLYSAQLALLEHQGTVFSNDVGQARAWLLRYFDASSPPVIQAAQTLERMRREAPHLRVPDISASLDRLRHILGEPAQS
ncbi:MAG: uroporphyrinogen-III C-methyltransferase [Acidiferrobacteraceae bacterium]